MGVDGGAFPIRSVAADQLRSTVEERGRSGEREQAMSAVCGEPPLVRICDLAGRPRGSGFVADDLGTLVTSHEAVDGLNRAVVHAPGDRTYLAESGDITPLPEWNLALIRTAGLGLRPLAIGAERVHTEGTGVLLRIGGRMEARLAGTVPATYTSTDRFHAMEQVLELALPEAASVQLRLSRRASGTPVLDASTGAVLGVLGTALHAPGRSAGFAVPLYAAGVLAPEGPLGVLLRRNGACVPGFGPDLNLAGALELTAISVGAAVERSAHAVVRPGIAEEFAAFAGSGASVAALVGDPGTGRTTELAALAARRARGVGPEPTVWLRGADLRVGDGSVREAVGRALASAGRIVAASREAAGTAPTVGNPGDANPDVVARLARAAGRPLLVLLDSPEEMPPQLGHALRQWTAGTASWLRASGARLAVACRPEYWEQAGALFPQGTLYAAKGGAVSSVRGSRRQVPGQGQPGTHIRTGAGPGQAQPGSAGGRNAGSGGVRGAGADPTGPEHAQGGGAGAALPPCVRLGELPPRQAARVRAGYGLPDGALEAVDAGHPLAMRMLSQVRAAQGPGAARSWPGGRSGEEGAASGGPHSRGPRSGAPRSGAPPSRPEIFSAHLDLVCLRVAVRLLAAERAVPPPGAVRRLAARVAGQLHEAARRCLGRGQGELNRASFEEIFPWGGGWASAVLAEEVLAPAGSGYRFADEEFADWLQGRHLELDGALDALVHDRSAQPTAVPVPRYRIGPVVQSLLLCARRGGPEALVPRLRGLLGALGLGDGPGQADAGPDGMCADSARLDGEGAYGEGSYGEGPDGEAAWWAAHLLGETLLRVPDARPYTPVLRALAERVAEHARGAGHALPDGFGPWFWRRLPLRVEDKAELLRLLLPADAPYGQGTAEVDGGGDGWDGGSGSPVAGSPRFLDVLGELLAAEPRAVQPLLCRWFSDLRPLPQRRDVAGHLAPTVATAAQALLHTHRRRAVDDLIEALADAAHPRADELLAELVHDEPSAVCRAVDRWAHDARAERRAAAAGYGALVARRIRAASDRELLRHAARALLLRPRDRSLHGAALAVLVRDPGCRSQYVDAAVARFSATGDPELASGLGTALTTHPEPVLAVFQTLLSEPSCTAGATRLRVLGVLAEVRTPALARRAAGLVREYAAASPETAQEAVTAFVRRRLAHGPAARAVLQPLVAELLRTQRAPFRASLARALGSAEGQLRDELLEVLLTVEEDATVLEALLDAAARHEESRDGTVGRVDRGAVPGRADGGVRQLGELVRRIGLLMVRTPQGAADFDRALVALAKEVTGFAAAVREWVAGAPGEWTAVVGPGARRMCDSLAERA